MDDFNFLMDPSQSYLLLKRAVNVKAVVTPRWKEEKQQQLQLQIDQLDEQKQQLETQEQRMVAEMRKQIIRPDDPAIAQQMNNFQLQVNQRKSEILERRNQVLLQLQQVQLLDMDQEVSEGLVEGFCRIEMGDNLIRKMQIEVLLRDGVVEEIRGEL
ncbi:MAG: YlqD family protein [Elainellaceae cyanobacterium]|jgi:exonuclease VII large subunit